MVLGVRNGVDEEVGGSISVWGVTSVDLGEVILSSTVSTTLDRMFVGLRLIECSAQLSDVEIFLP